TRLAGFKVPKQIHVMAEFPKNPTGKVLKRELRKRFTPDEGGAAAARIVAGSKAAGEVSRGGTPDSGRVGGAPMHGAPNDRCPVSERFTVRSSLGSCGTGTHSCLCQSLLRDEASTGRSAGAT